MMKNPFRYRMYNGLEVETISADDRIEKVKKFSLEQCYEALAVAHLQKSVERAVFSRIRALGILSAEAK
jgi:hypothetical protein